MDKNNVRLIDANALKEYLGCDNDRKYSSMIMHEIADRIDEQPTIDAVPVVHSSWGYRAYRSDARITVSGEAVCRKCHAPFFRVRGHLFKYCPNCGAKMDAKEVEADG